jgi:hypothetical protein
LHFCGLLPGQFCVGQFRQRFQDSGVVKVVDGFVLPFPLLPRVAEVHHWPRTFGPAGHQVELSDRNLSAAFGVPTLKENPLDCLLLD